MDRGEEIWEGVVEEQRKTRGTKVSIKVKVNIHCGPNYTHFLPNQPMSKKCTYSYNQQNKPIACHQEQFLMLFILEFKNAG